MVYAEDLSEAVAGLAHVEGMHIGADPDLHLHGPLAFAIALNQPVRHHTDRLMNQFESAFALANRLDRKRPNTSWSIHAHQHVHTQPLIEQADVMHVGFIQLGTEMSKSITLRIVEEPIAGS